MNIVYEKEMSSKWSKFVMEKGGVFFPYRFSYERGQATFGNSMASGHTESAVIYVSEGQDTLEEAVAKL